MGTGGPRAVGPRHPPTLPATTPAGPPPLSEGGSCGGSCVQVQWGPHLQQGPRREVPGFPLREELRRGSQAWRDLDYIFVTPG